MSEAIPLQHLQQKIEFALNQLSYSNNPAELYDPIKYTLSIGGKRIRPVMLLIGCNLFSDDINPAMNAAIGIEVFHNFTLVHDDIMDNAPLRRGKPTAHVKWNNNVAILSGDTMFVKACELMMQCEDNKLREVLGIFYYTATQVCEGQQMDMNFETNNQVSSSSYIEMITLKTAVLLAASFQIGAILGGAVPEDAENMYEFGKNLGIAFQLQDDILDVYGDPEKFGKQVGGDIISNKKTYLLLKALESADRYKKEELHNWLFAPHFKTEEKVEAVTEIYNFLGVQELAKKEFERYYTLAFEYLNKIPVSNERKSELIKLATLLAGRQE